MATIIPFPRLGKIDEASDEASTTLGSMSSKDLETLIDELQGNLASIRAHFIVVQNNLNLIVAAEKDAQTY